MVFEARALEAVRDLVRGLRCETRVSFARGRINGIDADVRLGRAGKKHASLLIELHREGRRAPWPIRSSSKYRVPTGDLAFDDAFRFTGRPIAVAAVFDALTRRRLGGVGHTVRASSFRLEPRRMELKGEILLEEPQPPLVSELISLAMRLERVGTELPEMLLEGYSVEPHPGVRRRLVEVALSQPESAPVARLLLLAAKDRDPELRMMLAEAQPGESVEILRRLFEDETIPEAQRLDALRRVRTLVSDLALAPSFEIVLMRRGGTVKEVALGALTRLRRALPERCLAALAEGLVDEPDPVLSERLVEALSKLPSEQAERALLFVYSQKAPPSIAVVTALGAVGSGQSLRALSSIRCRDPAVRAAAAAAVACIKARLPLVEAGALSLSKLSGPSGALSFSSSTGELSMSERRGALCFGCSAVGDHERALGGTAEELKAPAVRRARDPERELLAEGARPTELEAVDQRESISGANENDPG